MAAVAAFPGAAPAETGYTHDFNFGACGGFAAAGSNPYFSLRPGKRLVLAGREDGTRIRVKIEVLPRTEIVDGVRTRVVKETETHDGRLYEISRNWYAICNRDNSVAYFGERVNFYNRQGKVIGHDGSWRAGVRNARPGIIMPVTALVGAKYFQELAPGVAMDRAEHVSMQAVARTPAGTFRRCLKLRETTPLEPDVSLKKYARGVGIVEDGSTTLIESSG